MIRLVPNHAAEAILNGSVDVLTGNIRLVLFKDTYDANAGSSGDVFLADVASGDRVAISPNLAGKTATDGKFGADDVTVTGVTTGLTVGGYWVFHWTGSEATSRLLGITTQYADSTPIALVTDGSDIVAEFANGLVFGI